MAQRRTPIQVPTRQDDEAPASPEQLQFIRQLVTGMSLSGFRFDYRKLGTLQAASVIDQLLELREASGVPVSRSNNGGCIGSLVRGTVRLTVSLIVLAVVIAGVGVGGYLIYQKMNESPTAGDEARGAADSGDAGGSAGSTGGKREVEFFGHKIEVDDDGQGKPDQRENPEDPDLFPDTPNGQVPKPREPGPVIPQITPPPKPRFSAEAIKQIEDLELLLAQLKTFTRKDTEQVYRAESVKWMQKKLESLSPMMDAITSAEPALSQRIRKVVADYAADEINGAAMREEIDAIREKLKALVGGA